MILFALNTRCDYMITYFTLNITIGCSNLSVVTKNGHLKFQMKFLFWPAQSCHVSHWHWLLIRVHLCQAKWMLVDHSVGNYIKMFSPNNFVKIRFSFSIKMFSMKTSLSSHTLNVFSTMSHIMIMLLIMNTFISKAIYIFTFNIL